MTRTLAPPSKAPGSADELIRQRVDRAIAARTHRVGFETVCEGCRQWVPAILHVTLDGKRICRACADAAGVPLVPRQRQELGTSVREEDWERFRLSGPERAHVEFQLYRLPNGRTLGQGPLRCLGRDAEGKCWYRCAPPLLDWAALAAAEVGARMELSDGRAGR